MASIAIRQPFIYERDNNLQETKAAIADGGANADGNSIAAGHFVTASGAFPNQVIKSLRAAVQDGVYGWCPDGVRLSTDKLPKGLPGGDINHNVFNCAGQSLFLINLSNAAGAVGATVTGANASIGLQCGMVVVTVGSIKYQCAAFDNTTQKIFEIVGLPTDKAYAQATTDFNPLVLVKVIPTSIQA